MAEQTTGRKYKDCPFCGEFMDGESRRCQRCRKEQQAADLASAENRRGGGWRAWTAAEEQFIVDHPEWTYAQIGAQLGRGTKAVASKRRAMVRDGKAPSIEELRRQRTDRLYQWHWQGGMSIGEIAERVDRPRRTVMGWFEQAGIPIRGQKQAIKEYHKKNPSGRGPFKDRSGLPTSQYFDLVHERRKAKGWTAHEVLQKVGVSWTTIFGDHRPRPEYVVRLAGVLEIDRTLLLDAAGYPEPSPARWRMLEALAGGMTRQQLSLGLGVTLACICRWLKNFDSPLSLDSINKIDAFLGLTEAEKDAEIGIYYAGEKLRRSRQSTTLIERHYPAWIDPEESKARMKAVWDDPQKRRDHIRLIREGMEERKIHIDKEWLREQLDQGLSYAKIGKKVGVSGQTVRQRSIEYDLREGESRQEQRRRRKAESVLAANRDQTTQKKVALCERALARVVAEGKPVNSTEVWKMTLMIDDEDKGCSWPFVSNWWRSRRMAS